MTTFKRLTGALLAIAAAGIATASPAHAGLLGSLGTTVANTTTTVSTTTTGVVGQVLPPDVTQAVNVIPADYDPLTPIEELLGGSGGLGNVLEGLTCKPLTEINELATQLGVNPITSGLTSLACSASFLDYHFVTRFGSEQPRVHNATVGVPTLLNVDGDSSPDLIGTISVTSLNTVGLTIDRVTGETSTLPVQVEAVLTDSGGGLLGRDHLAFGYDSRMDRAPGRFVLATPANTVLAPSPDFQLTVSQQQRGEKIALLGGIFDGSLLTRQNPAEVRIDYSRSPDTATLRAQVGGTVSATLTTNRPGPAVISGRIVESPREDRFDVSLDDLPSSLSLTAQTSGALQVTYAAAARVARLRGTVDRLDGTTLLQRAQVELDDVPTGMTVSQDDQGGSVTTTGGPIGRTKVGVANGLPKFLAGEPAYVNLDDDGTLQSVAVQLLGLERASFAVSGDAVSASAKLAGTPFLARVVEPGRSINARVHDLPSEFDLSLDPTGVLDYDGKGSGIDRITLDVDSATPIAGRATTIRGVIEDIPALLHAALDTGTAGRFGVEADNAIGLVELVAANRAPQPDDLPAGGEQGAKYTDLTGGDFVLGARIRGLRKIAATLTDGGPITLETHTAGGPFGVRVALDDLRAHARIEDLPAKLAATIDLDAGKLLIDGKNADDEPQGIERLTVDADADQALFGRATDLKGVITGIPAALALDLAQSGDGFDLTASEPLGSVELAAADRPVDLASDLPVNNEQGAKFIDRSDEYLLSARVRQFKRVAAALGDVVTVTTELEPSPFGIRYATDELNALARIQDLPAQLTATIDLGNGKITTNGSAPIELLTFDAQSTQPVFGGATDIAARIDDIPQALSLDLAQNGTGARLAASEPIGSIQVAAADRPVDLGADVPANQGVTYVDNGSEFLLGARVEELRLLDAALGDDIRVEAKTKGGPFDVRVDTADLDADAAIRDLPQDVLIALNAADGKLVYTGKDGDGNPKGIDSITASVRGTAAFFDRARRFDLEILKLAPSVTVDLAQGGAGASIQTDQPIESISFAASDDPTRTLADAMALIGDPQGAVFRDTASEYTLAGRVLDLQQLTFGLSGEAVQLTSKLRSTPFKVGIASGNLDATARIVDLPEQATVALDLGAGTLQYAGRDGGGNPKAIDEIRFSADAPASAPLFGAATKLRGNILQVPSDLAIGFSQTNGSATLETQNGAIGTIEFLATNQDTATFPMPQGATFRDRNGEFTVAARVLGLKKLVAGLGSNGGPISLNTETAGGLFKLDVATSDFVADGEIADLPAVADLKVDLDAPADADNIRFTGSSAIGRITLNANSATPLLGRADKLFAELKGLPEEIALKLSQTQGQASVQSRDLDGNPTAIDSIEVAAWNDSQELPPGGSQGAVYRDVPNGPFRIGARVLQLKELSVAFGDAVNLSTETAGGPFKAIVQTADLTGNVDINDLPTKLDLGVDLDAGKVTYAGSSVINEIVAALESATPLFGNAKAFKATFTGVPQAFEVVASPSVANQISLKANQGTINKIELQAGPTLATLPPFPTSVAGTPIGANDAGAFADLSGGKFELAARVIDLNELTVDLDPVKVTAKMATGRKFFVDAKIPVGTSTVDLDGIIDQLPSNVTLGLVDRADADGGSEIQYSANAAISRLYLRGTGLELLPGANDIEAELLSIPQTFALALPATGAMAILDTGATGNNAADPAIGEVRLRAGSAVTGFPGSSTLDFIKYVDRPGQFGIGARISGVRYLSATLSPIDLTLGQDTGQNAPIDVEADIQDSATAPLQTIRRSDAAQPVISQPSATTRVQVVQGAQTRLVYTGAAGLNGIRMRAINLAGLPKLDLRITDIPSSLNVCFDGGPDCYRNQTVSGQTRPVGGSNNYQPKISVDAVSNHTSGFVVLNGAVNTGSGGDITIENVKFRNLTFDLTQGNSQNICIPFTSSCASIPRIAVVIDSDSAPFLIGRIVYDSINPFRLGSDGDKATAQDKFLWVRGFGFTGLDQTAAGNLQCNGGRELRVSGINFLDMPLNIAEPALCND